MIDLETYAERTGIPVSVIKSKTRKTETVVARQVYWFYLKSQGFGYSQIARIFEMNHSTVVHGIKKIEGFISVNEPYVGRYLDIIKVNNYKLKSYDIEKV